MDILRPINPRARRLRLVAYSITGLVLITLISMGLAELKPAAPAVEQSTVWIDTVKRGAMLRQVRAIGTIVPEEVRWIPAVTEGRIEQIKVLPGTKVEVSTILLQLSNPQLRQEATDVCWKLKAAEADYTSLQVQLDSEVLSEKSDLAKVESEYAQAKMEADLDTELNKAGVISELAMKLSQTKAQQLYVQDTIERERLENSRRVCKARLLAKHADIEQLRALVLLKEDQVQGLEVRAGTAGVLQEQLLKIGQWVNAGATLAKVVQPERLKAELKVPETQAKDVQLAQAALIDTHNGLIQGRVIRIDPSVQNGTVTVDISLDSNWPAGVRPDLSIEGTIDLERLPDVLYIARPAFAQENNTIGMFRLDPHSEIAVRTPVALGRASANAVEVVSGLQRGDQVILSDMSRWDNYDHIRLH